MTGSSATWGSETAAHLPFPAQDPARDTAVLPRTGDPFAAPVRTAPPPAVTAPRVHTGPLPDELPADARTAPRGRVLVVEGGFAAAGGRWPWSRQEVSSGAPALSAVLAAVSPQVLLAADAVDAVHLPTATDPQTVLAHLRAAARHPGPVLVHLAGHILADRRSGRLHLALRDSRPSSVRHDGLPWQWIAAELRSRPAEWGALVIADLSADESVWPQLHTVPSPLAEGLPLWAAVSPDQEYVGVFTRALVEALHGGQPGAGPALTPEQLQHQVQSVLRPEVLVVASHGPGRPVFRNTARRTEPVPAQPAGEATTAPRPTASAVPVPATVPVFGAAPAAGSAALTEETTASPVSLHKPAAPIPAPPGRPPSAHLAAPPAEERPAEERPAEPAADRAPEDYRETIGRIVRAADAGEHATAVALAAALERDAIARHGESAAPALHVRQVRAHVARLAGHQALAADLYRDVALKLRRTRGAEDPETQQAASNADACWRAVHDLAEARRIAPAIIAMRAEVPGPDGRKLRAAERYLAQLGEMGAG